MSILTEDERTRIIGRYRAKRNKAGKEGHLIEFDNAFPDSSAFVNWWQETALKQEHRCYYCETPIKLIACLIEAGKIDVRGGKKGGKRGKNFEIERKDPSGLYDPSNCALVCMYCNNDKSNIYSHDDYKKFFAPARKNHFNWLWSQLLKDSPDRV